MRFADVVKCAANLVMPMGWKCTADFSAFILYAHFPFPFFQRFATVGRRKSSRPETDAMYCHSSSEAPEASGMP